MSNKFKLLQKSLLSLSLLYFYFISPSIKTFNINEIENVNVQNIKSITPINTSSSQMTYGRFLDYLEMGWVKQVDLYDNSRAIVQASSPELGNRPQSIEVEIPVATSQLIQKLKASNVDFDAHNSSKNIPTAIFNTILLPLLFLLGLFFFFQGTQSEPMNVGKSKARFDSEPFTGITFKDVAGLNEATAEVKEIVSFLREPDKYRRVGARIPKGILLVGPPGTGKTLLAKAIASEAFVPFFSIAGSEFVEMFIGIGASRIRDLFAKAADKAPCLIFIDEIDAVGRTRGSGVGGGNDEREQTLNQLLTEMDGFTANEGVIVIGATNRVDTLDNALLRPGRFDRQITIGLPNRDARTEILKVHTKNKPLSDEVSAERLANRTPGFSGADLANVLNEAAILSTRYKKTLITKKEVDEAIDRIIGGIPGTSMDNTKYKRLIAYHEVGHAIVGTMLFYHDKVEKVTIIPRAKAKGLTWFMQNDDQYFVSRANLLDRITTTLAGRITEQIVFGDTEITTGAGNDLQQATNIARQMVTRYGMSPIGPIALEGDNPMGGSSFKLPGLESRITKEIIKIINYCEERANKIILENRVIIDLIVDELLELESMDGDEFKKLLQNYSTFSIKYSELHYSEKTAQDAKLSAKI